jgi:hypothetical protein
LISFVTAADMGVSKVGLTAGSKKRQHKTTKKSPEEGLILMLLFRAFVLKLCTLERHKRRAAHHRRPDLHFATGLEEKNRRRKAAGSKCTRQAQILGERGEDRYMS